MLTYKLIDNKFKVKSTIYRNFERIIFLASLIIASIIELI